MSVPAPLLCLPGPEQWHDYGNTGISIAGAALRVHEDGGRGRGTAWAVWDGAAVLARFVEAAVTPKEASPGTAAAVCSLGSATRIVELGAGTGLAGLAAACVLQARSHLALPSSNLDEQRLLCL